MIQEVHHRVKNNLQSVASLLRLQARRSVSTEARAVLADSVNRILSIAVVHEFLSEHSSNVINVREVAQRIINQVIQSAVGPEKRVHGSVEGTSIYLPSQQATSCALVLNELLLNSVEHGFRGRDRGSIQVGLQDDGDRVTITVADDGGGLPPEFGARGEDSLGLTIVRTLVESDLKGQFDIRSAQGTLATVTFPKATIGGGDSWNEPE
jgi:two-component system, sensor histidine kinase PdtaS